MIWEETGPSPVFLLVSLAKGSLGLFFADVFYSLWASSHFFLLFLISFLLLILGFICSPSSSCFRDRIRFSIWDLSCFLDVGIYCYERPLLNSFCCIHSCWQDLGKEIHISIHLVEYIILRDQFHVKKKKKEITKQTVYTQNASDNMPSLTFILPFFFGRKSTIKPWCFLTEHNFT